MHNTELDSGAVYVFKRTNNIWNQQAYTKASNTQGDDFFGISIALSNYGSSIVVGASQEASNATGINGDQTNNTAVEYGAVYIYYSN